MNVKSTQKMSKQSKVYAIGAKYHRLATQKRAGHTAAPGTLWPIAISVNMPLYVMRICVGIQSAYTYLHTSSRPN